MHSWQYAMHPNPSNRPVGVLNLNIPAPQHSSRAPYVAVNCSSSSSSGGGRLRDELGGNMMAGDMSYAHWDTGAAGRRTEQVPPGTNASRISRSPSAETGGRASASPPIPNPPTSSAPPPPPPPPPPPVLSAAQKEHLKQLQKQRELFAQHQQRQHQHQQVGGTGGAGAVMPQHRGGAQQYMTGELALPSPSRHRIQLADTQPSPRGPPRQHWLPGQPRHPGALPLPRFTSAPQCPSPVVKVPIYSTLSEAIEHQQKQQQQQQQQQQIGTTPFVPPPPPPSLSSRASPLRHAAQGRTAAFTFDAPSTPGCYSPRIAMIGNQQQPRQRGFNDRTMPAPEGYSRPQQQQQQQERVLYRARSLPAEESQGGEATVISGVYDGVDMHSPRISVVPQNQPCQAPVSMTMPLQEAPGRGVMQPPSAPPAGLRLQMCGAANTPMSAPVTPVMVYAYPHGYMMAYPPVNAKNAHTPRSARSQTSKAWDPYECVSPSGESTHAGFGPRCKETRASSLENSPVASSRMSVSSREIVSKPDGDGQDHDSLSQGQRSRASSVVSDVIERGFYDDDNNNAQQGGDESRPVAVPVSSSAKPALSLSLSALHGNITKSSENDGSLKTPSRRARGLSIASAGDVTSGEDKENSGGFVGKKRDDGFSKVKEVNKQLSGHKRVGGAIEIEKQKSFTGSYFQVSPGSFLQSSKRQRHFA